MIEDPDLKAAKDGLLAYLRKKWFAKLAALAVLSVVFGAFALVRQLLLWTSVHLSSDQWFVAGLCLIVICSGVLAQIQDRAGRAEHLRQVDSIRAAAREEVAKATARMVIYQRDFEDMIRLGQVLKADVIARRSLLETVRGLHADPQNRRRNYLGQDVANALAELQRASEIIGPPAPFSATDDELVALVHAVDADRQLRDELKHFMTQWGPLRAAAEARFHHLQQELPRQRRALAEVDAAV